MTAPRRLPLVPSTVTVNGVAHGARSIVWAGLRWWEAHSVTLGSAESDHVYLLVPFYHPDRNGSAGYEAVKAIRPRYDGWRFVQCRSGAWMLEKCEQEERA